MAQLSPEAAPKPVNGTIGVSAHAPVSPSLILCLFLKRERGFEVGGVCQLMYLSATCHQPAPPLRVQDERLKRKACRL